MTRTDDARPPVARRAEPAPSAALDPHDWAVPCFAGVVIAVIGVLAYIGWWRSLAALSVWFPAASPLPFGMAAGFVLAGASLILYSHPRSGVRLIRVARMANLVLLVVAIVMLCQPCLTGEWRSYAADQWLGAIAAVEFLTLGVAMFLGAAGIQRTLVRMLALSGGLIATYALAFLLYGVSRDRTLWGASVRTVHAELGFMILALALLYASAHPRPGAQRIRWSFAASSLGLSLMLLAGYSASVNLQRVRVVIAGMESSRLISRHLECAEDDVAELSGLERHHPGLGAPSEDPSAHLDRDLEVIDTRLVDRPESQSHWARTRAMLLDVRREALAAKAHGERPGTNPSSQRRAALVAAVEQARSRAEGLEREVEGEWDLRWHDMMQWGGASSLATGLMGLVGLALLAVLGGVVWRMNHTLEHRVRQRTSQLEDLVDANRQGQQRLQLAIEGTGIGFWEWNVVTNQIRWDAQMFRIYGIEPTADGSVTYEVWRHAVLSDDVEVQERILQETARSGGRSSREFRIRRAVDGEVRILSAMEHSRPGPEGPTEWVVGTNLDVTDTRHAEQELRRFSAELEARVEERNAQVVAASKRARDIQHALDEHAIVGITDLEGRITYVNDRFCELTGFAREELIGQDHRLVNSGVHPRAFFQELRRTIHSGQIWKGKVCNRAKNGTLHWVSTTVVPILDADGQPEQFVVIRDDITEARRATLVLESTNCELGQRTRELERSNAELEQFAYVASHDLQEPLRAVSGCVQLLHTRLEGHCDDQVELLVGHAVDGVKRMHDLIQSLLQYSRIGTRGGEPSPAPVEDALAGALADLSTTIRETGARVTHDALPIVAADHAQLRQLFLNLIGNAIKFHGSAIPEIHVSAERLPAGWEFRVRDNGIGIEPRYHERIFEMFQRLHTREEYPGTGIGLAICRKIVERHGGGIRVESAPGQGTTFRFTIADQEARHDQRAA